MAENPLQGSKKYYASGQRSTVNNRFVPTRKGRPGTPLQARGSPNFRPGDTSGDRYYREGGSRMSPMTNGPTLAAPNSNQSLDMTVTPLRVQGRGDIRAVVQQIVSNLQRGEPAVVVQVADAHLEGDVRLQLDLQVAREAITRDRYRDVRFELIPPTAQALAEAKFGPPVSPTVRAEEELPTDFAAYVKGEPQPAEPPKTEYVGPRAEEDAKVMAALKAAVG